MKYYVVATECTCGVICHTGGVRCQGKFFFFEEAEGMVGSDEKEVRNS